MKADCGGHAAAAFVRGGRAAAWRHRGMAAVRRISGGMAAALLLVSAANAMPMSDYIGSLERMRNEPRELAAVEAKALIGIEVDSTNGRFTTDTSLLEAIANKRADALPRLDATIAALRGANRATASNVDPKLLDRLRNEERVGELQRGGELLTPEPNKTLLDKIAGQILKAWDWVLEKLRKFFEWLEKLWPSKALPEERASFGGTPFVVTALMIAIIVVLAIVAFEALRRSRRAKPDKIATSDPIASRRDEDPLSRGATEWERYAVQLAEAGRIREAIRAWYHAVLVTCYMDGILGFRKGRTNWEYVSMMRAEVAWRPLFADLTRRFEREWYGRAESTYEALDDCSSRAQEILGQIRRRGAA